MAVSRLHLCHPQSEKHYGLLLEHSGNTATAVGTGAQAKASRSWNDQVMQDLPAESVRICSFQLLPQLDRITLGGCAGTPYPPLWCQHLDFQVFAKASHPAMGYPEPKGGKTRRGSQRVKNLSSGGIREHCCYVLGTNAIYI